MRNIEIGSESTAVQGRTATAQTFFSAFGLMLFCVGGGLLQAAQAQQPADTKSAAASQSVQYRAVLTKYCFTCHNEKLKTAGLVLEHLDVENAPPDAEVWEKVIGKLRTSSMPPAAAPRPDKSFYDNFATYLETSIDKAAAAKPNAGRPAVHRLNRTEYANVVRDLLGVEVDARSLLPADDSGYGFDNIGDVLSVSPALTERYMSAAQKISRLAIGLAPAVAESETYTLSKLAQQDDRASEDLPFESRGGAAIRHTFLGDGEYSLKVILRRNRNNFITGLSEGLGEPHVLEVRVDGVKIKEMTIGGERKGRKRTVPNSVDGYSYELDPEIKAYELTADAGLEFRFPAKAGMRTVGVSFVKPPEPESILRPLVPRGLIVQGHRYKLGNPEISTVTIVGPYSAKGVSETTSHKKIFTCNPSRAEEETPCANKIISAVTRRAYRRPATDADVRPLMGLYKTGRGRGDFASGIGLALQGMLVSPDFLFRVEADQPNAEPGSAHPVSDLELASRLSFFLWSSMPDDQLLDLAARGKLKDRQVLEQQVRRMLEDRRSNELVKNFAGQWLYLRNVDSVVPDPDIYPDFDDNLREAFRQETEMFIDSNLRENRSLLDLLNADFTFVNERLARHYGIPNIYGSHFRRVVVADENRRGLLGQGAVLTVTSYATRTSVVLRGKWLLENVLGTPPPPPPPNVPSLNERGADGKILSIRQLMERHRANPVCATCHSRMDPLGFALENFDGIGKWRSTEGATNTPIDTSGALPDGTKFKGPSELRNILLGHPEQFVDTVSERLLTYALGRGVEYYDAPALRKIVRQSAPDYRWSSIITGIVESAPFQMRSNPKP